LDITAILVPIATKCFTVLMVGAIIFHLCRGEQSVIAMPGILLLAAA
jgi:hypothetical protein